MLVDFVALDVETANAALSSICQVGIVCFRDGKICSSWESLVNPQDYFSPLNIAIHGIELEDVQSSPTWGAVYPALSATLSGNVIVSHTAFDRASILRACERSGLATCDLRWLDSSKVVRRAWPTFCRRGYGLANVAAHFCIQYKPHDALEDARCAGEIMLRTIAETGSGIDQWLERVKHPISRSETKSILRQGSTEGPLYGEVVVFTGSLSMVRREAADAASAAGCEVDATVTKRTTILVIGDQDIRKLVGHEKSQKHRKAESLISSGQKIRIVGESDFIKVIRV